MDKKSKITKKMFKKFMTDFKAYIDYETALDELDIRIWEREEVSNLVGNYLDLLAIACGDTLISIDYNDIEYFIYDLDFGERWKKGMITDKEGNDVPMSNLDELWDALVKNNPELGGEETEEETEEEERDYGTRFTF